MMHLRIVEHLVTLSVLVFQTYAVSFLTVRNDSWWKVIVALMIVNYGVLIWLVLE